MMIRRPGISDALSIGLCLGTIMILLHFNRDLVCNTVPQETRAAGANFPKPEPKPKTFEDFLGVLQDDPELITYLRKEIIDPPSTKPYKLDNPERKHFSEHGQSTVADKLFNGQKKGLFIEVGAVNGEFKSNTLYLERELQWTGILIEPNKDTYLELLGKNRKAWMVNGALSPIKSPTEIKLRHIGKEGQQSMVVKNTEKGQKLKAFPLYSLLLAINMTTIDFFSLDIESQEMKILRTLPWDKLKFKVLCIEKIHIPEGVDVLIDFVQGKGYKLVGHKGYDVWFVAPEMWTKDLKVT